VVQVQEPTFFNCQVLVKAAPAETIVPSGMLTSLTNCALSQTGEALTGGLLVAGGATLKITRAVPVGEGVSDGDGVDVADGVTTADWVHCACRVCAAAVRATFGVSAVDAVAGTLQAVKIENTTASAKMRKRR
jgi:hypothetical protein